MGSKIGGPGECNIFITQFFVLLKSILVTLQEACGRYVLPWGTYNLTEEQNKYRQRKKWNTRGRIQSR